jgi:hypothetical protein
MSVRHKLLRNTILLFPFLIPTTVLAAPGDFKAIVEIFTDLIAKAIPIIFALALLAFFWGLALLILYADDVTKRTQGKHIIVWGIIVLFLMVSIWGILTVLDNTFF